MKPALSMYRLGQGVTGHEPQEAGSGHDTDVQSEPRFPEHQVRGKVSFSLIVTVESVKD